jgi:hypothetical protein
MKIIDFLHIFDKKSYLLNLFFVLTAHLTDTYQYILYGGSPLIEIDNYTNDVNNLDRFSSLSQQISSCYSLHKLIGARNAAKSTILIICRGRGALSGTKNS